MDLWLSQVYRGMSSSDDLALSFWEVIESFTHKDRARFLRFVWGRSRLPRATQFAETFKVGPLQHLCRRVRLSTFCRDLQDWPCPPSVGACVNASIPVLFTQ